MSGINGEEKGKKEKGGEKGGKSHPSLGLNH